MEAVFESSLKYDFGKSLEQYRVEYKILQEEFAHLSLINSKNYTSQPNINRKPSVDRFLTIDLSGSNDSIDSRRKHASEVQEATRSEVSLELGKLKHDKGQLEQENSTLREMLIQLERQVSSLKASNRQYEESNESLVETIQRLENQVKTLESGNKMLENVRQVASHGSKKNSESDDEKCFVYVDAEEFPDPL